MTVKFSLWKSGKKGELLGGEFAGKGGVWDEAGVVLRMVVILLSVGRHNL